MYVLKTDFGQPTYCKCLEEQAKKSYKGHSRVTYQYKCHAATRSAVQSTVQTVSSESVIANEMAVLRVPDLGSGLA